MKKMLLVAAVLIIGVFAFMYMKPDTGKETVVLKATDNGWDSQKFHNALAKYVLENAYDGYELTFSTASSPMNWESMKAGDIDLDIECWSENMPTYKEDKEKGEVVDVGILVPDSAQGIYVLRFVVEGDPEAGIKPLAPDLRHVRDLKKYASVFPDAEVAGKGRLYGAIPGWRIDEILYNKFLYYGMDETFVYTRLGSEASIFTAIVAANNLKQPWVGYCYEPTWVVGKVDLIRLEDEPYNEEDYFAGKTECPRSELKVVSNNKFKDKVSPEVYSFFQKYRTGSAGVSAALAYIDDNKASYEDTAAWFLKNNDSLIDEWLPASNAEKLRKHLSAL